MEAAGDAPPDTLPTRMSQRGLRKIYAAFATGQIRLVAGADYCELSFYDFWSYFELASAAPKHGKEIDAFWAGPESQLPALTAALCSAVRSARLLQKDKEIALWENFDRKALIRATADHRVRDDINNLPPYIYLGSVPGIAPDSNDDTALYLQLRNLRKAPRRSRHFMLGDASQLLRGDDAQRGDGAVQPQADGEQQEAEREGGAGAPAASMGAGASADAAPGARGKTLILVQPDVVLVRPDVTTSERAENDATAAFANLLLHCAWPSIESAPGSNAGMEVREPGFDGQDVTRDWAAALASESGAPALLESGKVQRELTRQMNERLQDTGEAFV